MKRTLYFVCGLVVGLAVAQVGVLVGAPAAQGARTDQQRKCDYTFVEDSGRPNIGRSGKVEYSDAGWEAVVEGGWVLKVGFEGAYVFEKCQ